VDRPASLPAEGQVFHLFVGKGGVGKTTLACATALRLAQSRPHKQVLLISTDPAHSVSDCLGRWVGPHPSAVCPGLAALEVNAEAEFERLRDQYAEEVAALFGSVRGKTIIELGYDREALDHLLDLAPPGLDEVMALTRIVTLLEGGKYDTFVIDTAPTGHLIRLLQLPAQIHGWLRTFFGLMLKYKNLLRIPKVCEMIVTLSKRLKVLESLLADPSKGQLYAVSIMTEMAFAETTDLVAACRKAGMRFATLFLNMATPSDSCPLCDVLAQREQKVRDRFAAAFADIHQSTVYRWVEPRGLERLTALGQALYLEEAFVGVLPQGSFSPIGRQAGQP
jgi:arsenite-transporting ATPase